MLLVHQVESLERATDAARGQVETPARELEQVLATRAQALRTSKVTHLEANCNLLSKCKSDSIHVDHASILIAGSCTLVLMIQGQ